MRTLYIGEMIFFKLPEEEQKKFELFNSYKPSYMSESIQWMEENDESEEWYEEEIKVFQDLADKEDGNQIRIKEVDPDAQNDDDYDVDWEV